MKKKLLILICCVSLLGLVGCGKNDNNLGGKSKVGIATIVDNNGETKKMTAKELLDIYNNNEAKFKKYYAGAEVNLTGIISSIDESFSFIKGTTVYLYVINLEDGWRIEIRKEGNEDFVADIDKGTKIQVSSNIVDKWNNKVQVYGVKKCSEPSSCYDELDNPYSDIDKTIISIVD